jgi:hypothetical protein
MTPQLNVLDTIELTLGRVILLLLGIVAIFLLWAALGALTDEITRRRCKRTGRPLPPWIRP